MTGNQFTNTGTNIEEVKRLNAASGLSYKETLAILAQSKQGQTMEEVPLKPAKENLEVDSDVYKINEVPGNGSSAAPY